MAERGIHKAPFVDVVEQFLEEGKAEPTLKKFNDMLASYRRMEASIEQRKGNLENKIPELSGALKAVQHLVHRYSCN